MKSRLMASALFVAFVIGVVGCAEIHITSGEKTKISYQFGVLRIIPDVPDSVIATKVSGFGLIPLSSGMALGWAKQDLIAVADSSRCNLIVFVADGQEFQEIRKQLLADGISVEHVCGTSK